MKQKPKEFYTEIEQFIDTEYFLASLSDGFRRVVDPRESDNQIYQFTHLLLMIVCAVLAGANTIVDIHAYAVAKERLFRQFLGTEKAPSYSVFWWLITRMDPKGLEECLIGWIQSLPNEIKQKIVAIDGKRLRGASRSQKIHLVSAWDSLKSLLLGQVKTAEKSNEIRAIPELLENIDLNNAVVTIDAAGCQKDIVKKIRERGGDYVIALKGNQGNLLAEAENFFQQAANAHYEGAECDRFSVSEKGHGRIEEREVVVTNRLDWLNLQEDWSGLNSMIEVTSRRTIHETTTEEKRYYISSKIFSAREAGDIIRSHWSIENRLHWSMDVNFLEDRCLVSVGHAPENFAIFRRLVAALIRMKLGGVAGTARLRRQARWNDESMLEILSEIFSIEGVKKL